jgi:putative flippase GtrA
VKKLPHESKRILELIGELGSDKIRYLIAGAWNTIFGYFTGLGIYYSVGDHLHVLVVALMANVLAITMAFLTYKIFVFRTKGNWLVEYFRAYVVYGTTAVVGIGLLWFLVDGVGLQFWLAQGLAILITVVVSYIGHSRFTFRRQENAGP